MKRSSEQRVPRLINAMAQGRIGARGRDGRPVPIEPMADRAQAPVLLCQEAVDSLESIDRTPLSEFTWRLPFQAMSFEYRPFGDTSATLTHAFCAPGPNGDGSCIIGEVWQHFPERNICLLLGNFLVHNDDSGAFVDCKIIPTPFLAEGKSAEKLANWEMWLECQAAIVGFSLTLLHCKNVTVRPADSDANHAAATKSFGKRVARYHVLDIKPMARTIRESVSGDITMAKALHVCRGHFKEFSQEKPLFGRLTGKYWWAPHVRGDAESGVVLKDYRVRT